MSQKTQSLKVEDFYTDDTSRGFARIDYVYMDYLGASTGDTIEIMGRKRTVAKCKSLYAVDEGRAIIRLDKFTRKNADIDVGEDVRISKIDAPPAEKVTVVPLKEIPPGTQKYVADALDGVPITKHDELFVPYFDEGLLYKVIDFNSSSDAVIVTQHTEFLIT